MSVGIVSHCWQQGLEPSVEVNYFTILEGEGIFGVVDDQKIYIKNSWVSNKLGWTNVSFHLSYHPTQSYLL